MCSLNFLISDAIGMGLNLNIRRIIFSSLKKFDGEQVRYLTDSEIKQIGNFKLFFECLFFFSHLFSAGRAGRFNSRFDEGEVTTLEKKEHQRVRRALRSGWAGENKQGGLFPTVDQLEFLGLALKEKKSSSHSPSLFSLLEYFEQNSQFSKNYFLCDTKEMKYIAEVLDGLPLPFEVMFVFSLTSFNFLIPSFLSTSSFRYILAVSPVDIKSTTRL